MWSLKGSPERVGHTGAKPSSVWRPDEGVAAEQQLGRDLLSAFVLAVSGHR
jgi:hypothetical protein